ncbi:hypothetical protein TPY_1779 [Sulfobacillus acidophilus TPY]|nr:hypothetical protein TPY_1779 [Sulfobacillus acidophilus TPY]
MEANAWHFQANSTQGDFNTRTVLGQGPLVVAFFPMAFTGG